MINAIESRQLPGRGVALKRTIAIVLSDGCDLLGIGVLAELLTKASELPRRDQSPVIAYETLWLSVKGGYVHCGQSLSVSTKALIETRGQRIDRIFLARGTGADSTVPNVAQSSWLQTMRGNGSIIRFLPAGFINNSPSTEPGFSPGKWEHGVQTASEDRFAPVVRAAFDIIRSDLGDTLAREAIRHALGDDKIAASTDNTGDPADKVRLTARWLRENCHRPLTVADAADACAMSERSLLRHFRTHLGTSPSEYLQAVRLELACEMLATTTLPADKIARRVGLGSGDRLGKLLRRLKGMTTTEYRVTAFERALREDDGDGCMEDVAAPQPQVQALL